MNASFCSALGKDFSAYLSYKRALGRKFDTEERALRLFDRFLIDERVSDAAVVQPALIEAFLASRPLMGMAMFGLGVDPELNYRKPQKLSEVSNETGRFQPTNYL
ncbi:hypothetical protein [Marinobacter sp. ELB17]|uniref:hypothetical protein n=1 Tax=Marinobacter sp. ELB17 TaxID=270374 RepID=UPI0000F3B560|nr:hypothetical protein [Marinobacter sp. ELB17]EAZ97496.1 hypothetical protein MELB17_00580 [Marinobacter sp. ELB17]